MTTPSRTASSPLHLPDLLLGAATIPLLVGLVASRAAAQTLQELGILSEEVFRGDRLPFLSTPSRPDSSPDPPTSN